MMATLNDAQRRALQGVARMQAALPPGKPGVDIFGYVPKPCDAARTTMYELVDAGLLKDFLATGTGHGDLEFYRLTDAGALEARRIPLCPDDGEGPLRPGEALLGTTRAHIVMD